MGGLAGLLVFVLRSPIIVPLPGSCRVTLCQSGRCPILVQPPSLRNRRGTSGRIKKLRSKLSNREFGPQITVDTCIELSGWALEQAVECYGKPSDVALVVTLLQTVPDVGEMNHVPISNKS